MSEALTGAIGPTSAPPIDPDTYQFDAGSTDSAHFLSVLQGLPGRSASESDSDPQAHGDQQQSAQHASHDGADHSPTDNAQMPPDDPAGGSGRPHASAPASIGAVIARGACIVGHAAVGGIAGAAAGAAGGAVAGATDGAAGGVVVGTVVAPGPGTAAGAAAGGAAGAAAGAVTGAASGAFVGSAAGAAYGITHCGNDTSEAPSLPQIYESRRDPGLTRPTAPVGSVPTGVRSKAVKGAGADDKAGVDSENQVADKAAAAGYRTVQRPTDGPNPPLTPKRIEAEGLNPKAKPDLLLEGRVFDTYTPVVDDAGKIRNGIADKVKFRQTHRVVVDLRQTTQTQASVRAALRANPVPDLKEVIILTQEGLGQPFRP
jgi:Contact-dependent growth inhibition CdiA C-terminal domain